MKKFSVINKLIVLLFLLSGGNAVAQVGTFTKVRVRDEVESLTSNSDLVLKGQGTGAVNIEGIYTLPTVDGTNDQIMTTNGMGALSWTNKGGGGGVGTLQQVTDLGSTTDNDLSLAGATFTGGVNILAQLSVLTDNSTSVIADRLNSAGLIFNARQGGTGLFQIVSTDAVGASSDAILRTPNASNGNMIFQTNGTNEALRLDNAQNATFAGLGTFLSNIEVYATASTPLIADRTNDGVILNCRVNGVSKVRIETLANDAVIRTQSGFGIKFRTNGQSTDRLNLDTSGNATFSGEVTATDFILSSDMRYKTKTGDLGGDEIKYISYTREDGRERFGVSAQQVQSVYPNLVNTDEDGKLSVSYIDLYAKEIAHLHSEIRYLALALGVLTVVLILSFIVIIRSRA